METSFTFGSTPKVELTFSANNAPMLQFQAHDRAHEEIAQKAQVEPTPMIQDRFQPPIANSFSFTAPEVFRTNKPSLLRWLNEVPTPEKRNESADVGLFQGEKRELDRDAPDNAQDNDYHRTKRSKLRKSWNMHPGLVQRREATPHPSNGILGRLSNTYRRVMTPSLRSAEGRDRATSRGSSSMPTTPSTVIHRKMLKFVVVGDAKCGKSSLLLRYYKNSFNQSYTATKYDEFSKTVVVNGKEAQIETWDTSGNFRLHQLELMSYQGWDAVLLCFNLTSQKSFNNAQIKWLRDIKTFCKNVPILLVGLKKDERSNTGLWTPFYRGARISAGEGSMAANAMGALKYMECSAKTGEGIDRIFEEGARMVLEERAADEQATKLDQAHEALGNRLSQALCFS